MAYFIIKVQIILSDQMIYISGRIILGKKYLLNVKGIDTTNLNDFYYVFVLTLAIHQYQTKWRAF